MDCICQMSTCLASEDSSSRIQVCLRADSCFLGRYQVDPTVAFTSAFVSFGCSALDASGANTRQARLERQNHYNNEDFCSSLRLGFLCFAPFECKT